MGCRIAIKSFLALASVFGLLLLVHPFLKSHLLNNLFEKPKAMEAALIFIDALLAASALLHNYIERMALHQHAKQYGRMRTIFSYASDQIANAISANSLEAAFEMVHELGKQALAENGDWVILHRERPLEVPHP